MTQAQAKKLATDEIMLVCPQCGPTTSLGLRCVMCCTSVIAPEVYIGIYSAGWDARQDDVDRLTAENDALKFTADCFNKTIDVLKAERDQLRELAGEMAVELEEAAAHPQCWFCGPKEQPPRHNPDCKAPPLLAKAKALGIGGEG